jgi:hypothetical protein
MQLIAQMPEPSESEKRAIAKMNSPEGWQKAIKEIIGDTSHQPRKANYWLLAIMAVVVLIGVIFVLWHGR